MLLLIRFVANLKWYVPAPNQLFHHKSYMPSKPSLRATVSTSQNKYKPLLIWLIFKAINNRCMPCMSIYKACLIMAGVCCSWDMAWVSKSVCVNRCTHSNQRLPTVQVCKIYQPQALPLPLAALKQALHSIKKKYCY